MSTNLAYFDIRTCVGLWSVCCRFVIGLSSGLSVCCRLRFQHCANDRFQSVSSYSQRRSLRCHVGYLSVSNRAIPHRILPEMTPTWTRLVLRCLQQHCRWPTDGRFIENFAVFERQVAGQTTPTRPWSFNNPLILWWSHCLTWVLVKVWFCDYSPLTSAPYSQQLPKIVR